MVLIPLLVAIAVTGVVAYLLWRPFMRFLDWVLCRKIRVALYWTPFVGIEVWAGLEGRWYGWPAAAVFAGSALLGMIEAHRRALQQDPKCAKIVDVKQTDQGDN